VSEVLIYTLITLVALLGIVLLAPFHFDFLGEYAENLSLQGRVRWAGGLLTIEIIRSEGKFDWAVSILGIKRSNPIGEEKTPKEKKPSKSKKERAESRGGDSSTNISSFLNLQFLTAVKDVFHKLMRTLHLVLNLSGTYGFDDPSLTGVTLGMIAALNRGGNSIDLHPDFIRAVVDIRGSMRGWVIPLQILAVGIVFLLKKPVRAIWWPKIKFRKKQKEAVQYA